MQTSARTTEECPLKLPNGAVAVSLPWDEDHAWIVEASTRHEAANATWIFGEVFMYTAAVAGSMQCCPADKSENCKCSPCVRQVHRKSQLHTSTSTALYLKAKCV